MTNKLLNGFIVKKKVTMYCVILTKWKAENVIEFYKNVKKQLIVKKCFKYSCK